MNYKQPKYQLSARVCGVLNWLCPFCGHVNRHRLARTSWRVQCRGGRCRRHFAVGYVFHSLASARSNGGRPPLPPPDVTFPLASLELDWREGESVSRFVDDEGDSVIR